jgi:hypothetical protein
MRTKRSRKTSKRTVIQPRKGDRRYVRRNKAGQFKKEVNAGRSLAADRRSCRDKVAKGQGRRHQTQRQMLDASYKTWPVVRTPSLDYQSVRVGPGLRTSEGRPDIVWRVGPCEAALDRRVWLKIRRESG